VAIRSSIINAGSVTSAGRAGRAGRAGFVGSVGSVTSAGSVGRLLKREVTDFMIEVYVYRVYAGKCAHPGQPDTLLKKSEISDLFSMA
jgi:hypothetical protein